MKISVTCNVSGYTIIAYILEFSNGAQVLRKTDSDSREPVRKPRLSRQHGIAKIAFIPGGHRNS